MKRTWVRALQGLALSAGSPVGWLVLRAFHGANPLAELFANPGVYLYMLAGTALAFSMFGWYVGQQEEFYREYSLHDPLTGLYNPRYFWRHLTDELSFARRHQRSVSLLIGDLDYFKRVNDNFGHAAGDQVLVAVGGALMTARRGGDTVARIGGEEFAVILPDADLAEAVRVAERLRAAVDALHFQFGRPTRAVRVSLSFGAVVSTAEDPLSPRQLYERADAAMYRAKKAGRNCVVADEPVRPAAPVQPAG